MSNSYDIQLNLRGSDKAIKEITLPEVTSGLMEVVADGLEQTSDFFDDVNTVFTGISASLVATGNFPAATATGGTALAAQMASKAAAKLQEIAEQKAKELAKKEAAKKELARKEKERREREQFQRELRDYARERGERDVRDHNFRDSRDYNREISATARGAC